MCTKSKSSVANVQGELLQSSISKRRLGGTQPGWMGEMSVPITVQVGCSSAKSLGEGEGGG